MRISKTVKIGFIATLSIAILVWGINYLKGNYFFKSEDLYYAIYNRVDGLTASSPVVINGYKIGQVRDITLKEDLSGDLLVVLAIDDKFELPRQTTAYLYSSDILGSRAIQMKLGKSDEFHEPGDTLTTEIEVDLMEQVNMQVLPVKQKAENLMQSFDSVLVAVRSVFNEKTRENLSKSFASIKTTINNLEHTTHKLDNLVTGEEKRIAGILSNIDSISTTLKNNGQNLSNVMNNFSNISDSIAQADIKSTIDHAEQTLASFDEIMTKINKGQGTMGMLLHNDTLYTNLENVTYNLNRLVKDLHENPKRYIHFSAIDLGKTTYIVDDEEEKNNQKAKKLRKDKKFKKELKRNRE